MAGFDDNWSTCNVAGHVCDVYRPSQPSEHGYVVIYLHGVHEEPLRGKVPFLEQFEKHGLTVVAPICGPTWWADRLTPRFDKSITPQGYVREQVMDALLETNPLDIPQTLKHQEAHSLQHEAMQRLGIEDHDKAPPIESFSEAAEKRVRLGLLLRQVIADNDLKADEALLRERVEEMCASYENSVEMVEIYMTNPQVRQQIEPMVVEQLAIDWLLENGRVKSKKVSFKDYMNAPAS